MHGDIHALSIYNDVASFGIHFMSYSFHNYSFKIVFNDTSIFSAHSVQNNENKTEQFRKITSYNYQEKYLRMHFNSYANKLENPH